MASSIYYQFGTSWIQESESDGSVFRRAYTSDPRTDPLAELDHITEEFADGSTQTTWFDKDGKATLDSREP